MYKKVLLAVDGSEDAKRAAVRLIDLYEPGITKIVMFHSYAHHLVSRTISEITPSVYTIPGEDYTMIQLQYKKAGEKILNEIKKLFSNANIDVETRLISDEEPEDYIQRITDEENFDLVALGCKGDHSKLKQIFMGSIAQKILNSNIPADILAVR